MEPYHGPARLAHRGVGQTAPENTMEALTAAYENGLEGIEIDIRLSRDGQVVVVHDATLERLTAGGSTPCGSAVVDLVWEQLAALRLPYANHLLDNWQPGGIRDEQNAICRARQMGRDPAFPAGAAHAQDGRETRLILLDELLARLKSRERPFLIEIEYKAPGMMPALTEALARYPHAEDCIIFSGESALNEEIQHYAAQNGLPEGVGLGANLRFLNEEHRDWIARSSLREVGLNDGHITREDVDWLRERGIQVFSNLGDYPEAWRILCELQIDAFKTNYSGAYTEWWRAEYGK